MRDGRIPKLQKNYDKIIEKKEEQEKKKEYQQIRE